MSRDTLANSLPPPYDIWLYYFVSYLPYSDTYYFNGPYIRYVLFQNCSDCGQLIVPKRTIPVIWGHVSILEADLVCLNKNFEANKSNHFVQSV
jgi:hypothetical protein